MSPRRLRLGAALLLPEPARREVDALRRALGDGSLGRVPAHLTLVAPVNVPRDRLPEALELLADAGAGSAPLEIELGPPATFLPDNPVVYLSVGGDLEALESLRGEMFRPPLEREPSWPWVPHVTLCDDGEADRVESAVRVLSDYRARVTFERVHLLVQREGTWEPWADAAFGGRRVVGRGGIEVEIEESSDPSPDVRSWANDEWASWEQVAHPGTTWDEQRFTLTARAEGAVVGLASGWTNGGVSCLGELIVSSASRGTGVGSHLLAAYEDLSRRRGATRLTLRTALDGPAQGFYEDRGWRVDAVLEDWVRGEPVVQLRKDL